MILEQAPGLVERAGVDFNFVANLACERYGPLLAQIRRRCQCQTVVTQKATKTDSRLAARCAAVASIGAAVIHIAVTPAHLGDWLPSGVFFAVIALFQLVWGFLAWWYPTKSLLAAGILANVGSTALWVVSRTTGAPFGPNAGEPEAVEAGGICVLLLQCYVVMGAAWALHRRYRAEEVSGFGRALVLLGATTVVAGAVAVGVASSLLGQHHHHGETEAEGEQGPTHATNADSHHGAEPVPVPNGGFSAPEPASAPDMGFTNGGDPHHAEPVAPVANDDHQHSHGD